MLVIRYWMNDTDIPYQQSDSGKWSDQICIDTVSLFSITLVFDPFCSDGYAVGSVA